MISTFSNCIKHVLLKCNFLSYIGKSHYCSSLYGEKKIKVGENFINYVKTGYGKHVILCFPGALGTIWSDFKPQILHLDKSIFTVVAFDPLGYGNSRPPDRNFSLDFYKNDAVTAYELMKALGLTKFSLLGWSDGGISSIILAAKYPSVIDKLIIWGANSFVESKDIESYEQIRDINKWSKQARAPLIDLYSEECLQSMWSGWCDVMQEIQKKGGNICMDSVSKITCPTLILHGGHDPLVIAEHPIYLNANIRDSRLHIFPRGKHNIHLRYAEEFNKIVTDFIVE